MNAPIFYEENMPSAIDQEKLDDPSLKVLDIGHPPTKSIPHESFPKMLYLHPKDKTLEHRTKIVLRPGDLEAATSLGWKTIPHVPIEKPEDMSGFDTFESEDIGMLDAIKRGPGRPPKAA
jgi:hypothetical protein